MLVTLSMEMRENAQLLDSLMPGAIAVADTQSAAYRILCAVRNALNLPGLSVHFRCTKSASWIVAGGRMNKQKLAVARALAWGYVYGLSSRH